jgi:aspartyl aminopeptidase
VFIGSRPFGDGEEADRVKLTVLDLLHEKYGMVEEDFLSAELMAVPAYKATDIGLDRSAIGAYGQDDRVCSYACLRAILDLEETPPRTAVCVLADKEEIGSVGNTGLDSNFLSYFISDLAEPFGLDGRDVLSRSQCLSADVNAAFDPIYPDVTERRNASFVNRGCVITKYTGSRGKGGTSDASAEVVAYLRRIFAENGVVWQMAELGKVDQGGGGTIAKYMANRNIDTIDAGTPVLSMHAPFEVTSKFDCYMTYKAVLTAYKA